jgi:molecular chaperone HtpG
MEPVMADDPPTMPRVGADAALEEAGVDMSGLLKVLSSHLYSTPEVALRELVQNAHDSCTRRELEHPGGPEPRIVVEASPSGRTVTITDNGAGLTDDEVRAYLATLGAGYTRTLRERSDALIGAFGLGFLTAYVVAERVVVHTTSVSDPARGWRFSSRDGLRFTLQEAPARPPGTEVVLHLKPDMEHLADPGHVRSLVERYAALLPHAVCVPDRPVNDRDLPWEQDLPVHRRIQACTRWAERFDRRFRPLAAWPLESLPDGAHGIFWIQDGGRYGSSDNRSVSVFVRGMLVDDDAVDLLPDWAGFCGAVVVSDALKPTASRESLQEDATFDRLRSGVRDALIDGFSTLAANQPAHWSRVLRRHNEALLGACVEEPKLFAWLQDHLTVPTSEGDLHLAEVARSSPEGICVSTTRTDGHAQVLYRALGRPIVEGTRFAALPIAERYAATHGLNVVHLGTDEGDRTLFPPAPLPDAQQAALQELLGDEDTLVVPSRFAPACLPSVWVADAQVAVKRRLEDDQADARIASGLLSLARSYTATIDGPAAKLYLNLDNAAVQRLVDADVAGRAVLGPMIRGLAMLSAKGRSDTVDVDVLQELGHVTGALVRTVDLVERDEAGSPATHAQQDPTTYMASSTREATMTFSDAQLDDIALLLLTDGADGYCRWLDTQTGETHLLESRDEGNEAFHADPERYRLMPDVFPSSSGSELRSFLRSLDDLELRRELEDRARGGRGAYRRVRDELYRRGLEDLWHEHRRAYEREAVLEWLVEEGVIDDPDDDDDYDDEDAEE